MSKNKAYENRIPAFYRRKTIDLMLFVHVTAMHERNNMLINDAIRDFYDLYGIDESEFPVSNAMRIYQRVRNNLIWTKIKDSLDSTIK